MSQVSLILPFPSRSLPPQAAELRPSYEKCSHSVFYASLRAGLCSLLSIMGEFVRPGKTRTLCPRLTSVFDARISRKPSSLYGEPRSQPQSWDVLDLDAQWYSSIQMTHTRCALLCAIKIGELWAPDSSHSRGQHHQVSHRRLSQEQGLPPKSLYRHWGSQERHREAERNAEERG